MHIETKPAIQTENMYFYILMNVFFFTGKIHQYPDDHPHEGTLIGSGAPVWHHLVPACVKAKKKQTNILQFDFVD